MPTLKFWITPKLHTALQHHAAMQKTSHYQQALAAKGSQSTTPVPDCRKASTLAMEIITPDLVYRQW